LDAAYSQAFDTPPRVEHQPPLDCPRSAQAIGATGQVTVKAFIAEDGRVTETILHTSSGVDALDGAALAAVREWRFQPAKRDGAPVATQVLIPLRFDCR
ncbi:MAG: TonB family protein, partial [Candidatus Eisenbacteria bacterium]|nr:TonB family protein [Candidatus Eisenbacteria bacterium]